MLQTVDQDPLHTVLENIPNAVYILDANFNIIFMSKAFLQLIGMPDYRIGKSDRLSDILEISSKQGHIRQQVLEKIMMSASQPDCKACIIINVKQTIPFDRPCLGRDQLVAAGKYSIESKRLPGGYIYHHFEPIIENINKIQILKRVMQVSHTGFYEYDFKSNVYVFGENLLTWFSPKEQKIMQTDGLFALLSTNKRKHIDTVVHKALSQRKANILLKEKFNRDSAGLTVLKLSLDINYDKDGKPRKLLAVVHNITDYEIAKAKLKKQKEQAEISAKFRTNQLAHMSHEIRTPMGGVMGMADVLLGEKHDAQTTEKLKIIQKSSQLMMKTLNETLDHCKLMEEGFSIQNNAVCLEELINSTCVLWADRASSNGTGISFTIAPDLPATVSLDEFRLRQCLNNLISNAVKFTQNGQIEIICRKLVQNSGKTGLAILIKDTGIGMAPEHQKNLFKPYAQADVGIAKNFGGTGLGMSITKKIIDIMGGKIIVKSKKNVGTMIALALPLAVVETPERKNIAEASEPISKLPAFREQPDRDIHVLIVDDVETNRFIIECMLRDRFSNLHFACNGQEAIDILDSQKIDIVLMDIHMPVLSGIEATRIIRTSNTAYADIPIITVTADAKYLKAGANKELGVNNIIGKPVKKTGLIAAMRQALESQNRVAEFPVAV